jgi:hypothetical protein
MFRTHRPRTVSGSLYTSSEQNKLLAAAGSPLSRSASASAQGLTLVHFSAQPEPFLTQNPP